MQEAVQRFVAPFYGRVLHGNLLADDPAERAGLLTDMRQVAKAVTFENAAELWAEGWREALMASWWAAVHRWDEAVPLIRGLLLPSQMVYAGQAHCLALARIASPEASQVLVDYLNVYLARLDLPGQG